VTHHKRITRDERINLPLNVRTYALQLEAKQRALNSRFEAEDILELNPPNINVRP